jgi:hypothetical protein
MFAMRLGYRYLYLDDRGKLGDEDTDDTFASVYLAIGLMF